MTNKVKDHTRINDIFLGPLERPALQFFCRIMPAWVNPDILTVIGILGAVMIAAGYILTQYNLAFLWLASLGYFVNWFGDSLDGSLARYRDIQRPKYGYYVDHIVDVIDEFIVILALGISPLVHFEIAALALIGYLMLSAHTFLRTFVDGVFKISFGKLGPTEVRVIIVIINTVVFFTKNPTVTNLLNVDMTLYDVLIGVVALLLYFFFFTNAAQTSIELAKKGE
ncbi:MAG: CDP-alcohol phosphatidyltransferase family protein [Anaerolineales bacterium]|jgi:phosphatidylglycerophosphate synthase